MTKPLIYLSLLLFPIWAFAQKPLFITGEVEGGLLTTDFNSISNSASNGSVIRSEKNNVSLKFSVSALMDLNSNWSVEAGFSQTFRYWNLEGGNNNSNQLLVKHRLSYPSVFTGGWYRTPVFNKSLEFYAGTRLSLDLVDYDRLNAIDGSRTEFVKSTTDASSKVGLNVIPEIGIKGSFNNGHRWAFGIKYYVPLNGNTIEGKIEYINNSVLTETINYEASGQVIAASFRYEFKIIQ